MTTLTTHQLDSLLKRTAEAASRGDQDEYDRLSKIVVRVTKETQKNLAAQKRAKGIGVGECVKHGEYFLDVYDSPCPSCEDEE